MYQEYSYHSLRLWFKLVRLNYACLPACQSRFPESQQLYADRECGNENEFSVLNALLLFRGISSLQGIAQHSATKGRNP